MARKLLFVVLAAVVAGCSGLPASQLEPSACVAGEASYACQVERYQNVDD